MIVAEKENDFTDAKKNYLNAIELNNNIESLCELGKLMLNENNFKNMQRIALQTYKTFFRLDHRGVTSKLQGYKLTPDVFGKLKSFDIDKDENELKVFLENLPGALPYGVV